MPLITSSGFLHEILLAGEDVTRAYGSLARLARHTTEPVILTGSLAMNWHLLENGKPITKQPLNDIDVVVAGLTSLRPSLNQDFLIRHFHPLRGGGRILIMLVDEEHRTRIDLFTPATSTLNERLRDCRIDDVACRVVAAEDLAAKLLTVIYGVIAGEAVEPKYVDRFFRLASVVEPMMMKTVWREYRKGNQAQDFEEAVAAVQCSIMAQPDLLQAIGYSQDINEICPWCCASTQFPLARLSRIYAVLGYV